MRSIEKLEQEGLIYLFVVMPNNSGSTMISRMLSDNPRCSWLNTEGHNIPTIKKFMPIAELEDNSNRNWTSQLDKFTSPEHYNWSEIKKMWHEQWQRHNHVAKIYVEKSPPNVVRANLLQDNFPNSRFVVGIRNPYSFCKSVKLRTSGQRLSLEDTATHWVKSTEYQIRNLDILKEKVFFTYENFCNNPQYYCEKIVELVPELVKVNPPVIENKNEKRIRQLINNNEIGEINKVLKNHKHLLEKFSYEFIEI